MEGWVLRWTCLCIAALTSLPAILGEVEEMGEGDTECPDPYYRLGRHCYFFSGSLSFNWWTAGEFCRTLKGTLADIHDEEENGLISSYINTTNPGYYWIGGYDLGHRGYWYWESSREPMTFTRLAQGTPHVVAKMVSSKDQHCLTVQVTSALWKRAMCMQPLPFVCKRSDSQCVDVQQNNGFGSCPESFVRLDTGCYFFSDNLESDWPTASASCNKLGSRLAIVETPEEKASLELHVQQNYPNTSFWLGAVKVKGEWVWEGSENDVQEWEEDYREDGQQQLVHGGCMLMAEPRNSFQRSEQDCGFPHNFVCEAGIADGELA